MRISGVALELQAQVRDLLRQRLQAALNILPALALLPRAPGALRAPPPGALSAAPAARAERRLVRRRLTAQQGCSSLRTHQGQRRRSVLGAGTAARGGLTASSS